MFTTATIVVVISAAVIVGLVVITSVYGPKDPPYPKRWTRCHKCLDLYEVPKWEVEGFVCGKCRGDHK